MTALAQLRHVFAKDVRESRWMMVAYLCVAVALCVNAVLPNGPARGFGAMMSILVLSLLVVATAVQSDSPARADAFWASRPLSPAAVLAAKALFVLLLVAVIPIVGEFLGLKANGVTNAALPRMFALSVAGYVEILLMGALIAAVTPNLSTFVITFALATLIPTFAVNFGSSSLSDRYGTWGARLMMAAVAAGVVTLVIVYRLRDARRLAVALAVVCVAAMTMAFQLTSGTARGRSVTVSGAPIALHLTGSNALVVGDHAITVRFPSDSSSDVRRLLYSPSAVIHLANGRSLGAAIGGDVDLAVPMPRQLPRGVWLNDKPAAQVVLDLDDQQRATIAQSKVTSVTISGSLIEMTPEVIGPAPLRKGVALKTHGYVYRVVRFAHGRYSAALDAARTTVSEQSSSALPWPLTYSSDVVANLSPEVALVSSTGTDHSPFNSGSGTSASSGPLLLPGPETRVWPEHHDRTSNMLSSMTPADSAWFANARIAVVTWVSRGDARQFSATAVAP